MLLAQLPGVTPPTDDVKSLLGWVVAGAISVGVFFWRLHERDRGARMAALEAQHAMDEQDKAALRTRIEKMQEARAEAATKEAEDAKRIAKLYLERARERASGRPAQNVEDDWDIPTGVARAINAEQDESPVSVPLPRPQPPPREPSRQPRQTPQRITEEYRPRQKSRHDR